MNEVISNEEIWNSIKKIPTPYPNEVKRFVSFLEENQFRLREEEISSYLQDLESQTRINREGKETGYSVSWHNQHLKAVKQIARYILNHTIEIPNGRRWAVEHYLDGLKLKKTDKGIAKIDRVPNEEEITLLIEKADKRLSLMISFLVETSCRISEMIDAEVGKSRRQPRITRIAIFGKGDKERDLRCRTSLFDEIVVEFSGRRWLFEHSMKQYSRVSVTNRIKALAERTIGKPVTAHMLRHYRGTVLSEKPGISKAASELGHSDIRTTKQYYDHSSLSDAEYLSTL